VQALYPPDYFQEPRSSQPGRRSSELGAASRLHRAPSPRAEADGPPGVLRRQCAPAIGWRLSPDRASCSRSCCRR
jgi:hypothetical protein